MAVPRLCFPPIQLEAWVNNRLHEDCPGRQGDLNEFVRHIDEELRPEIEHSSSNTKPDLAHLVNLIDSICFGRLLGESIKIFWDDNLYAQEASIGMTFPPEYGIVRVAIETWPMQSTTRSGIFEDRITEAILNTVLHECMHAFLLLAGCPDGACGNQACRDAWRERVGDVGHGDVWHSIAKAVEDWASSLLKQSDLGRKDIARYHYKLTEKLPSPAWQKYCWPDHDIVFINDDRVLHWKPKNGADGQ